MLRVLSLLLWAGLSACSPYKTANAPVPQPMVGAWVLADTFGPAVQEAARFAVQTFAVQNKARLIYKDVTLARQQVVAGIQFELNLDVTLDGAARKSKAMVWRQLDGTYKLQAWDWMD